MIKNPHLLREFETAMLLAEFRCTSPAERLQQCATLHACAMAMHPPQEHATFLSPHLRHACDLAARLRTTTRNPQP